VAGAEKAVAAGQVSGGVPVHSTIAPASGVAGGLTHQGWRGTIFLLRW
jgi:hypothetical protein